MQFNYVQIPWTNTRRLIHLVCRGLRHARTNGCGKILAVEGICAIRCHCLGCDDDVGANPVTGREGFAAQNRSGGAARRRAALEPGKRSVHMRAVDDLIRGQRVPENGKRIGGRMASRLFCDQRKRAVFSTIALLIFQASASEQAECHRAVGRAQPGFARIEKVIQGVWPVIIDTGQGATLHLFEAQRDNAVRAAAGYRLTRKPERRRTGRAIIVDVDDRDAAQSTRIQGSLAGCAVAIDIADIGLLDRWIGDSRIRQNICDRVRRHRSIIPGFAGCGKGGHRHTGNNHGAGHDALL